MSLFLCETELLKREFVSNKLKSKLNTLFPVLRFFCCFTDSFWCLAGFWKPCPTWF